MSSDVISDEIRWQAVRAREAAEDGRFVYGVLTTGVYCRPSCPSRMPKRENVRFYDTPADAERDGLRPCLRCRPTAESDDRLAERIRDLCAFIEANADAAVTLRDLANRSGLSTSHLQRAFKAAVGVSPKQYLDGVRTRNLQSLLRAKGPGDVTGAIFDAGFGSLSRVYEKADTRLGMTPMEYREGGRGVEITYAVADTALGLMMIGATDRGLCFVQFGEDEEPLLATLRRQYPNASIRRMSEPAPPEFDAWVSALNGYLEGRQPDLRLPTHVRATAFQLTVWRYLQTIPRGSVESYAEVARHIGRPSAVRAVARACASNSVAIAIPCHRVIRGTGELGGYRWGLDRKRTLLDAERQSPQVSRSPA